MASPLTLSTDEFKKRYGDITAPGSDVLLSLTPEEFNQRYNVKSAQQFEQPPAKPISLAEKAFKSFGVASAGVIGEPAAAAIDVLGGVDTAAAIRKRLGEVQAGVQREVPELGKEFKFEDLQDPSFYATKGVSVLPALIALVGTGAGAVGVGARGAAGLASRLGAGAKGLKAAKAIGEIGTSALVSRTLEGALEASGTYNQLLNEGVDRDKAADAAAKVFRNNYALTGMDAAQYAAATLKLPPALSKGLVKWAANAVKLGVASGSEGLEELYQGYVAKSAQEYAKGMSSIDGLDAKEFWDYATRAPLWEQEEFVIGSLFGLGFQVGEGALAKYGKTEGELRQAVKRNPQEVIQTLKGQADDQRADNATREQVAQQAFGKKFDDLTDEQKQKIVDKAAEAKTAEEDARIDETLQGVTDQAEPLEEISQKIYKQPYAELPLAQRQALKKRYQALAEKARAKKVDEAIAEKVGLKKPKAEKPEKEKAQPPVAEAAATASTAAERTSTAAERTAPAAEPVAFKPEVVTPKSESSPSQQAVAPSPVSARAGEGPQPSKTAVVEKPIAQIETAPKEQTTPTHKDFDRAFETFQEVAAKQTGKPVPEQSAAIAEELRARNVNPVIIDELTNPRRALKPRNPESERSATSRPERIARAVEPHELKPKVDAVAQANVDFRNKEASLLKAREEIKAEIEARGGEVVVDTGTGAMTITLNPGKAKISEADQALIERLRADAADAGAYSLATVGQGFEVSATPERIADAKSLPAGDFKSRALEFLKRNAEAKEAEKVFKQAKEDARNDLVDYYLAERVAGKETPSALLGQAKDGTRVEVMARRVRSAAEPDLTVGGRDFGKEISTEKQKAKTRATETGEPFIESRKSSERQISRAQLRGTFISARDISNETEHESGTVVGREPLVVREPESSYNARPIKPTPNKFTVDVPTISLDDFKGKKVFIFAADRMRVGEYTGLDKNSGIRIRLQGGPLFPFIKQNFGKSGWAFSNKKAVNAIANRIANSDGIGLVMLQGESGVKGSKTFLEILFAELQHGLNKKDFNQNDLIALFNDAKKKAVASYEKIQMGGGFKAADKANLSALMRSPKNLNDAKEMLSQVTFGIRTKFIDLFFSNANVKEYGIPDVNLIIAAINDPIFKGMEYGDIVSAIQFDKNPKIGTAKELGSQEHFSYGIQISGKGLGLFKAPYDVRDILQIEKPKPHAARSAFLRQPIQKIEKKVKRGAFVAEQSEGYQPNRPGDFLTNPEAVFEKKPYEPNYKKRPDATPRTDRLAKEAVEAIGHNRRRGRVYLANAIDASARETGTVTLVGQTIRTSDDLAVLAQVYRDPRWETLRYVFVKDGKVVNVTGISNRLPSAASAYPFASREDGLKWLKGLMDKTGADGYYLLHNHPSGVSKPSQADIEMTVLIASKVPGFKEHVVIDSNEFSVLSITETTNKETTVLRKTVPKNFGEDRLLKPSIDHPLIGRVIASPDDVLTVAKGLEAKDGWVTLISTSQGRVRGIMQVEEPLMKIPGKRRSAIIRNFARQTGGADTFAVVSDDFMRGHGKALSLAVERGFIRDAVTMRGYSITDMSAVKPNREFSFGKIIKSGRVVKEGEAKQEIPDTITVNGKERPTRNPKGQLIHATQKGIENFWKWFSNSKVVDEQGRPLVVYHGSNVSFEEFSKDKIKSRFPYSFGFHFTSSAGEASVYADSIENAAVKFNPINKFARQVQDGANVIPAYIGLKNPLVINTDQTSASMEADLNKYDIIEKLVASRRTDEPYDGVIIRREKGDEYDHINVIALDAKQIKSAIGNRGTFSPEEPSIIRESESTYGKANLNRDQFLDLGKMVNDFLQNKEQFARLSKAEREEFAEILEVLKDYKELSEKADLHPTEKVLLKYAIRDIESPEGKRVIEKVQAALRDNKPIEASWLDKIAEWTASMYLWRLASVGSSIGSNLFRQLLKYPELKLAAWFNQGVARQTRVERTRFSEEAEKDFRDAWTGEEFKKAARKALDIMQEKPDAAEESKFFEREKVKRKSIGGKKGTVIRAGLNAQAAIDVLFRQPATTAAISRHSFREAAKTSKNRVEQAKKANAIAQNVRRLKAIKDAKQEVPEYLEKFETILAKAEADAEAQTFQSELEGFLKHVSEIRRYPLARIFVPFFNTRMNILLQAYDRTLLSALGREFRDLGAKALKKKLTAEEAGRLSDRMAEITLGTTAFLLTTAALYGLSDDDEELITGDFDEKTIGEKPAGWLPNAVRVGDTYVSLKGFEPYATIFTAFGNAASGNKSGIRNAGEALAKAAFSNPMTDELFDIMGSLKDGDADKFFVDMVAGAATPGLLQDIAKIVDPTIRQKEGLEERFKGRVGIPGLSTTLPERIDVFGEDLEPQTSGEKALKTLTGVSISKSKEDPARREIRKLGLKHKLDAITHKGVSLEPWEVLALNKSIGDEYHKTVLKLLQNPTYLAADKEARKDKLRSVRRKLIDDQKKILERSPYFMARERTASAQKKARERVNEQLAE